ncbi:hypothetical protein CYY_006616 [Polysphondylium violaceum]|uniref:SHSP domain-containing protein n=1 Tax=Polysphondylium violaceum TaxID=133409 RepID=A0A8J4V5Q9_9MYCE|nr:hypothetical protein CYY_006616 [Polysphondylium violaceum]
MNYNWLSHPLEELSHLRHSLDEALRGWSGNSPSTPTSLDWGWKPRMDVCESKNFYKIILELPGFQKEDLDVQVNGRFLSIKGSKSSHSTSEWKFHRRERYSGGEFQRAVALPEGIDGSSIQAKFQGGVLELVVPKTGGKNAQRISLMGKEEHYNRRSVIDMEEKERRRRMEENDPMLSHDSWVAGRMGTVIDEERERSRRLREQDQYYENASQRSLFVTRQLENKERERRIKDVRGESDKKKNALKISKAIKALGPRPRSVLGHGKSGFTRINIMSGNDSYASRRYNSGTSYSNGNKMGIHKFNFNSQALSHVKKLEESERHFRMNNKKLQREHISLAKRVSTMIKNSSGVNGLRHNSKNKMTKSIYNKKKNNTANFANQYNFNYSKSNHDLLANIEEKERERRLRDKKGQNEAKRIAAKISHMIGDANC